MGSRPGAGRVGRFIKRCFALLSLTVFTSVSANQKQRRNWGQPCDSAILNQRPITRKVSRTLGREFKLWPFSAGSILTLRKRIEPLRFRIYVGAPANINAR